MDDIPPKLPVFPNSSSFSHAGAEASSGPDVKKAKGMFMMAGLEDLEDEDLTDSSDEEEEEKEGKTKAVALK